MIGKECQSFFSLTYRYLELLPAKNCPFLIHRLFISGKTDPDSEKSGTIFRLWIAVVEM